MTPNSQAEPSFDNLGISAQILSILTENNFITPTPIQHQVISVALEGKDVVGIAQTGTGKTLAFGIPMIQRLTGGTVGQGLIVLPTRELALQVEDVIQKIGRRLGIRTVVLIGGASMYQQVSGLRRGPNIVIATPGRLIDHLQQKTYSLQNVKIVVLDEADRMFDIGFAPQIKQIMNAIPKERQTMLFSATMPREIGEMAARYMKMPIRIEVAPSGTTAANVEQEVFIASKEIRMQLLEKLLTDNTGTVLLFSRTKRAAKKIAIGIRAMGHSAVEIHSDRSLGQRKAALAGFKTGKFRVLVATDIAARGIDVVGISLVINFDLPDNAEDYVHRIGRTGRAGSYGKAVSFVGPDERGDVKQIERLIRKTLPIVALPVLPPRRVPVSSFQEYRPYQSQNQNRQYRSPQPRREGHNYAPRRRHVSSSSRQRQSQNRSR